MWLLLTAFFSVVFLSSSRILDEGCTDTSIVLIKSVPPKIIKVRSTGIFTSPGYHSKDQVYPDNVNCKFKFEAPSNMHVRIKFNNMDIDILDFCRTDSMEIHDFNDYDESYFVERHCGNQIPHDYVSQLEAVMLVLKSDDFGGRRGFNITYSLQSSEDVCESDEMMCRNRKCVDEYDKCNGDDDCGDGTDEEDCEAPLPVTICGLPAIQPDLSPSSDRIVGGQEAKPGSWPWMADLQLSWIFPHSHTCGGSLINAQWILSAAHCFQKNRKPRNFRIHLGNHKKFEKDVGEQIRYVEQIVVYKDIPSSTFEKNGQYDRNYDIALLKLNAPVKFTKYVRPVCLPKTMNSSATCYATGWGESRGSGKNDVLKQSLHPIQSFLKCFLKVPQTFKPNTMVCAGGLGKFQSVCHGDSGGPLVCKLSQIQWSISGVARSVTLGNGVEGICGMDDHPSVFSRVDVITEWIGDMIDKYSD